MSLRVAHVTATFPPYRSGTGNVCYHNARELARRGHDVHVFTALQVDASAAESRDGITIHRLRPLLRVGNAPLLPGLMPALQGFDVVHLHYPFFGGELTAVAALLRRTPLVITYHQDVLLSGAMGLVAGALGQTAGRLTLRSARRVLFTSLDYGRASASRTMLRGRESRIDELPNGVDIDHFHPAKTAGDLRARYPLTESDQIVLLVAGLDRAHYFKGVNVLLEALTRLEPYVKAVIVGDGDLRASYEASAIALGLGSRVHFAGRVSDEELPLYYRLADVTVLPSVTMGEAFGLVLVESMASGTPAIASNLPGVRTVIDHESDGLLVEPRNPAALAVAINCIMGDEGLRRAMSLRGREKVERRYAWEQIGERLENIYLAVLRGENTMSSPIQSGTTRSSRLNVRVAKSGSRGSEWADGKQFHTEEAG